MGSALSNKNNNLRDFVARLETLGELKRIAVEVDPKLEMTEICDRLLKASGPAVLFEKPKGHSMPVLGNLFGTVKRVALAMAPGAESLNVAVAAGIALYLLRPSV